MKKLCIVLAFCTLMGSMLMAIEPVTAVSSDVFDGVEGVAGDALTKEGVEGGENIFLAVLNFFTATTASEPVKDASNYITQTTNKSTGHKGTDFDNGIKTAPVASVKNGKVIDNSINGDSNTNKIVIYNDDGTVSRYSHTESKVKPGFIVTCGEKFGKVIAKGQPGFGSTNSEEHLDYEEFPSVAAYEAKTNFKSTAEVIKQWEKNR